MGLETPGLSYCVINDEAVEIGPLVIDDMSASFVHAGEG
jgi:hypothetical protein